MSNDQNNPRLRPFTENYARWDVATFDASKTHLTPKPGKETKNRGFMSRIYESIVESFSTIRQRALRSELGDSDSIGDVETLGGKG